MMMSHDTGDQRATSLALHIVTLTQVVGNDKCLTIGLPAEEVIGQIAISVIHLRPVDGRPRPEKTNEECTHEIMVAKVLPWDFTVSEHSTWPRIEEPPLMVMQLMNLTDSVAEAIGLDLADAMGAGELTVPWTPWMRTAWTERIEETIRRIARMKGW